MKTIRIVLAGGGTGGHIFPLVAVADYLIQFAQNKAEIFYLGPTNPLNEEFSRRNIPIYHITGAKWRRYLDIANFIDIFKFFWSIIQTLFILFKLMPDVVFSKGGPGALPVVLAAKFYFIPIIIHESDSIPGLTNRISAKFAKRIAISFRKTAAFFPKEKTVLTGNPIRTELLNGLSIEAGQAKAYLGFEQDIPLVLILGGSQGAAVINNFFVSNLENFLQEFQIYHQTGLANEKEIKILTAHIFRSLNNSLEKYYKSVGFLNAREMKYALAAADVVITRCGAGSIFEISAFGKPSILIPITESANNHQLINAYEYADSGAAVVVEEANFKFGIIIRQIKNIISDNRLRGEMIQAAKTFAKPKAAQIIAEEILKLAGKRAGFKVDFSHT